MIVLSIVFSNLFARGTQHFPIYVLIGSVLFSYMSESTTRSLYSVIGNTGLLKKIYVPKYIFTLATVTSELIIFLFSLGALIIMIVVTRAPVSWRFFFVLIPIIEVYVFCVGVGLFLAQAAVFFRDIRHIWVVIITAWNFLSAIFYPADILPDYLYRIISRFNPMYFYITMFRNFTIGSSGSGSLDLALRGAVAAGLMLVVGIVSFSYTKNKFILYI
jgi:lipopolysaccharide transport system permease protein